MNLFHISKDKHLYVKNQKSETLVHVLSSYHFDLGRIHFHMNFINTFFLDLGLTQIKILGSKFLRLSLPTGKLNGVNLPKNTHSAMFLHIQSDLQ